MEKEYITGNRKISAYDLYLRLCDIGVEFELVEIMEGIRVYSFVVEEIYEND